MTLWYYDHRDSELVGYFQKRSKWRRLKREPKKNGGLLGSDVPKAGDLIVVHGGTAQYWRRYAKDNPDVHIEKITVDGGPIAEPDEGLSNYKVRSKPWKFPDVQKEIEEWVRRQEERHD